jgi:hypothetical protein|tara:strand:- start:898 stop:1275 length:378 start_codon:yes stop_codon:yes gene_type:complete
MNTKQKMILGVGVLAIGGVAFYMWKKNKDAKAKLSGGGTSDSGSSEETSTTQTCMGGKESSGGGKGKLISIVGSRTKATEVFKKGMNVSVDGVPTTIIGMWKDKNGKVGALKLANGVSNGDKICY